MRVAAATFACLAALAAGAVADAATPAPSGPPPVYDFTLVYSRSSGLAPSPRSLVVAPAQFATAEATEPGGRTRRVDFRLGARRIRALERGFRRAHFGSLESPGPSGCADCFEYTLLYHGNYVKLDASQVTPRLAAVIVQIEAIISAHTKSPSG